MECTDSVNNSILHFVFLSRSNILRLIIKMLFTFFSTLYGLVGEKSVLGVPNTKSYALFAQCHPEKRIVEYVFLKE